MYSTCNEGKSAAAERFIRNFKSKIFKHMIVVSKNVYFHVSDNIVDKYNNTVHRSIKMKPIDVIFDSYADTTKILMKKGLNSKLVIESKFQNTKTFLLKDTPKIDWKKFLLLVKLKIQFL